MTKHESPMIIRWWAKSGVSGALAEEFPVVRRQPPVQVRRLDAIVVLDETGRQRVIDRTAVPSLRGRNVIIVQAKASRLSEALCGHARRRPPAPQRWQDFVGREIGVLVAKKSGAREGSSFGMSPVGYALLHREMALTAGAANATSRILTETVDPVMAELAERFEIDIQVIAPTI
jgi:hypothetical protein